MKMSRLKRWSIEKTDQVKNLYDNSEKKKSWFSDLKKQTLEPGELQQVVSKFATDASNLDKNRQDFITKLSDFAASRPG